MKFPDHQMTGIHVQNFVSVKNEDTQLVIGSPETALMQFGGINTGRYDASAKPEKPYVIGLAHEQLLGYKLCSRPTW